VPKAVEAFRNIGEVADELDVKKHVLRFWEAKFPQLKPMKRGGGRRLYRPADVALLRGIRDLLQDAGYTIKGVQKILREQGIDHVKHAAETLAAAGKMEAGPAPKPASRTASKANPRLLDASQVKALQVVIADLEACRALLDTGSSLGQSTGASSARPARAARSKRSEQ
jgi:DNA-binding transcriptional MerR regulator